MEYFPFVTRTVCVVCVDGNCDGIARSLVDGTGVNKPEEEAIIASEDDGISEDW